MDPPPARMEEVLFSRIEQMTVMGAAPTVFDPCRALEVNKVGREARELARRPLGDPEYWNSFKARLARGQAPPGGVASFGTRYGKPCVDLEEALEGADPTPDLAQLLEGTRQGEN